MSYNTNAVTKFLLCGMICIIIGGWFNQAYAQQISKSNGFKALETGFATIPDSVQTSIYWYWISDNISREGVIKDLEAMKKVGINRAFIGNIGLDDFPYGKVKLFSDEWWKIMHVALKTATRLNIEIGIFNSPGWSQSGGPWIKPNQSMRYLNSSIQLVHGPAAFNKKLTKPADTFQTVKVLAYPVHENYLKDFSSLKPVLSSTPDVQGLIRAFDHNPATSIQLQKGKPMLVDVTGKTKFKANAVVFEFGKSAFKLEGVVQAEIAGVFQDLKHFKIDRSNPNPNVGFKPYGSAALTLPETNASRFRIRFDQISGPVELQEIVISETPVVEQYIEKSLAKMYQTPLPNWTAYQWEEQPVTPSTDFIIDPAKVIDLTKYLSAEGTLNWKIPKGNWIIEWTGMSPTGVTNAPAAPEGRGLEVDKMSVAHVQAHFESFMGEILKRIPAEDRKTWTSVVQDSYETGGQNWTDGLEQKFSKQYGYDPVPYLPVLQGRVVGSQEKSDRFLWDLRRFIADRVAYDYVGGLREISHKNGLKTWLECYGHWGFPGEFLQYGGQSDEVGGEFWSVGELGNIENRAASSAAHIYGKTKVYAESFTSADPAYSRYPAKLKQRADRFFTEGINSSLLHVYIQQPDRDVQPGYNTWFGNEFNRNNTWFYDMDVFLQYLKRCNFMLQKGKYVADVAYFIGEDAPKMTGVQDPALPSGYSFDYINAEVILNRLTVHDGKLRLPDGMQYSVLVLPKLETMRPAVLKKIKELVNAGAIVLGPKPKRSPSLQDFGKADQEIKSLADQLWGKIDGKEVKMNSFGKGKVLSDMSLETVFKDILIKPDFQAATENPVLFIHRKTDEGSIYFLSNQANISIRFEAQFRVEGLQPEFWDPLTGAHRDLPKYTAAAGLTTIPLELEANGSAFIIFRNKAVPSVNQNVLNFPKAQRTQLLTGSWTVNFLDKKRGPAKPIVLNTLEDWTKSNDDLVKYYSGSAVYTKHFKTVAAATNGQVWLNLGNLTALAKVRLNGIDVGGTWIAPFKVDITNALKSGENKLEVTVVNTWVNRLIGDLKLPDSERKTTVTLNPYKKDSPLQPSGLLGPVQLEFIK